MSSRHSLIIRNLTDVDMQRLRKAKDQDEFSDREWSDWLRFKVSGVRLDEDWRSNIQLSTKDNLAKLWMQNFAQNLPMIVADGSLTLNELLPEEIIAEPLHAIGRCPKCPHGSALVVGAGPSIQKFNHVQMLADSDYDGFIIATDRMLIPLLKAGVVPDLTVTVDGNREKILKWYDDPILDKYGPEVKVALCSTVAHNVAERIKQVGGHIYWFHALYDDYRTIESFTRLQQMMTSNERLPNGLPAVSCLGHAGGTCWVFAHALFRRSPVALIGLDLGYHEDTKIEETQYFKALLQEAEGNVDLVKRSAFRELLNPHTGRKAVQDLIFMHYREGFLETVKSVPFWVKTINATGDGALFGDGIEWMDFQKFLETYKS